MYSPTASHIPASTSIIPSFKTLFNFGNESIFLNEEIKTPFLERSPDGSPRSPKTLGQQEGGRCSSSWEWTVSPLTHPAPTTYPCDAPGSFSKEQEWPPKLSLVLLLVLVLAGSSSALWRRGTGVSGTWGKHIWETLSGIVSVHLRVNVCVCTGLHSGVISKCWKCPFCRTCRDQVFKATVMAAGLGQELAHLAQPARLAHPALQQPNCPDWSQG